MKKFTWNNFDEEFISSIIYSSQTGEDKKPARVIDDKDMLIPYIEGIALIPTKEFVVNYRREVEQHFLGKQQELVEKIYYTIKKNKLQNFRTMLNELSKMILSASLIDAYITALKEIGLNNYEFEERSRFAVPVSIDLNNSIIKELNLYDFQEDAVKKLYEHFITNDNKNGLLVMPTGSGKTRTATYFLLKNMISSGYQVIWLAHRHMLIDQTADSFYMHSPLAKQENKDLEKIKITCVSGEHSTIRATEKDDNIVILSVQAVCRNLEYLKKILSKKVIIVVDEAHHTYAKSYQRTIDYIMKLRKDAKLLGLTATPIRGTDNESKALMKLFGDTVVYNISMGELIKKQVLADPRFEQIQTNTDFEAIISIDEEKLIKKYGEIPATLADKIAHSSKRNKIIVDTYMKNKEHYGKTLIFALNIFHCYTLCQELQTRGVRCDYIFSGNSNNELKIMNFKEGKLDVLVNVNILTEGSDVPDIETVFLTRPTQSEGLLMQMIGRGMRGKYSGGTEKVNIVDFNDKWEIFNKWLNPQWIIGAAIAEGTDSKNKKEGERVSIPWKLVSEIYQGIAFKNGGWINRGIALPSGWCSLVDEDGNDYVMFVWESQLAGFKELMRDKEKILRNKNLTPGEAILVYFGGFVMPPSLHDLKLFLENAFIEEKLPRIFPFTNRKKIDPTEIAPVFLEQNVGIADIENKVREIYDDNTDIIQDIYGDFDIYYDRVFSCIKNKNPWNSISADIEEIPIELIPYKIEPTHNIKELASEVIDEMFSGKYDGIESIEWTDKPYRRYYGIYHLGGKIRINKLLDSPFVDKEVVKFVIYHEFLHRDYWNHDKAFFREEHKYPDYTEHNRFLDHLIFNYNMSM